MKVTASDWLLQGSSSNSSSALIVATIYFYFAAGPYVGNYKLRHLVLLYAMGDYFAIAIVIFYDFVEHFIMFLQRICMETSALFRNQCMFSKNYRERKVLNCTMYTKSLK